MNICFYTICDTKLQRGLPNSRNLDFAGFRNSFHKFHPSIPLIIFDEKDLAKHNTNYYSAKATFGELLSREYDLVVNVDSDTYFFDTCTEILQGDYDVACPANFNETNNLVGIKVSSGITGNGKHDWIITEQQFLQGGLIASPSKQFWTHYKYATDKYYDKFVCFENDVLNLVAYLYPYKVKILDGDILYNGVNKTSWYGCSIINKEKDCYIENGKIMLEGKSVKAYHFAHGSGKKKYNEVFNEEVSQFIKQNIIA